MSISILDVVLLLAGLACVGTEVFGAYEFLLEQQGKWTYLVVGGMIVTSLAGILPLAAERARHKRQWLKAALCWFSIPLALLFVLIAGTQRTGLVADTDEANRTTRVLAIATAKKMEAEAEAQLKTDKALVMANCGIWGPICTRAQDAQKATETKLAEARKVLMGGAMVTTNSMAKRIVAVFPFLTEQQVQLYHPLLLPVLLGLFGSLLIGIGGSEVSRLGLDKPGKVSSKPETSTSAENYTPPERAVEAPPAVVSKPKLLPPPPASKPRLVAKREPYEADVYRIMKAALAPTDGERASMTQCHKRYKEDGGMACDPNQFMLVMADFCKAGGIKTKVIDGQPWLLDVAVVAKSARESA